MNPVSVLIQGLLFLSIAIIGSHGQFIQGVQMTTLSGAVGLKVLAGNDGIRGPLLYLTVGSDSALVHLTNAGAYEKVSYVTIGQKVYCKYPAEVYEGGYPTQVSPIEGNFYDDCTWNKDPTNSNIVLGKYEVYTADGKKGYEFDVEKQSGSIPYAAISSFKRVLITVAGVSTLKVAASNDGSKGPLLVLIGSATSALIHLTNAGAYEKVSHVTIDQKTYCKYAAEMYLGGHPTVVTPIKGNFYDDCTLNKNPTNPTSVVTGNNYEVYTADGQNNAYRFYVGSVQSVPYDAISSFKRVVTTVSGVSALKVAASNDGSKGPLLVLTTSATSVLIHLTNAGAYKNVSHVTIDQKTYCKYPAEMYLGGHPTAVFPIKGNFYDDCTLNKNPANPTSVVTGNNYEVYTADGQNEYRFYVGSVQSVPDFIVTHFKRV